MRPRLITIGEAAKMIGVSIDTLRRWDEKGKLVARRFSKEGHRYYRYEDVKFLLSDLYAAAINWVCSSSPYVPASPYYCENIAVFQVKLSKLEKELGTIEDLFAIYPMLSSIAGEIGNNSFDHNLGNWPDLMGVFFGYDLSRRIIVLADRGRGILQTLKRVRPELSSASEAVDVAFTEYISGRAPENRGNGLKFVKKAIIENPFSLIFQTGNAKLRLQQGDKELYIEEDPVSFRGCFAFVEF
ncbi:MAG: helix-turn-helix domain-containing protein [Patescibacteria group bacterium]